MASTAPAPKPKSVKQQPRCQSDGKLQKVIQTLAAVVTHNFMSKMSDAPASASMSDVSEVEVVLVTPIKYVKRLWLVLVTLWPSRGQSQLLLIATNT